MKAAGDSLLALDDQNNDELVQLRTEFKLLAEESSSRQRPV